MASAQAGADAALPTPVAAAPEPSPAPEPDPPAAPPAPNAAPATLQLAFHGHCKDFGVSTLDDAQRVVHYTAPAKSMSNAKAWLHRMDEHGAIAESLWFPAWSHGHADGPFLIGRVFGRWPDELRLLTEVRGREQTDGRLYRRVGDAWKQIETMGASTDIDGAWPWIDGSILALGDKGDYERREPRMAVVLGKGKGPSLAKLRRATKCKDGDFQVADAEVLPSGTVLALAGCSESVWMGTWTPGDLEGTVTPVSKTWLGGDGLQLDDQGNGFIDCYSDLVRWQDGVATPMEIPAGSSLGAREGHAWYARGNKLWRWSEASWEAVSTPEDRKIQWASGLGFDTPWLLFTNGTVAMRTADGTWHDVPLAPTPDLDETPTAALLYVTAPGEAWVDAKYTKYRKGSKTIGSKLRALYTTRDAPVPLSCGKEAPASEGT